VIKSVAHPITQIKSSIVFGAWMTDPLHPNPDSGPIWIFLQFIENNKVEEYANMRDLERWRPRTTYTLPYCWSGI